MVTSNDSLGNLVEVWSYRVVVLTCVLRVNVCMCRHIGNTLREGTVW